MNVRSTLIAGPISGLVAAALLGLLLATTTSAQKEAAKPRADVTPPKPQDPPKPPSPQKAVPPQQDAYAGKTVRNTQDGYGLIRARNRNAPQVGTQAPDFTLKTADGKKTVTLSKLRRQKPVVLVFGSFT